MSDTKNHSNRHKKRVIKEGLRRLKNKPGWDVGSKGSSDPREGLRQLEQQMRGNQVYEKTQNCRDCTRARRESADETALCSEHLAQAMGLGD